MNQPGADNLIIAARRVLLDVLDALDEHRSALVLVRAPRVNERVLRRFA